MIKLLQ